MGREIQERILARAHAIWVAHGCRAGCDAEYLDQASREVAQDEQLRDQHLRPCCTWNRAKTNYGL
jgi:Protein of unknown function (DUF2934)